MSERALAWKLVGHESQSICRVYIPEKGKVVLSKDIFADEINALAPANSEATQRIAFTMASLEGYEEAETVENIESARESWSPSMSGQSSSQASGT